MPEKYVKIRDKLKRQGKSDREAKRIAAATYNAQRGPRQAPVTRNYEKTKAKKARKNAPVRRRRGSKGAAKKG